MEVLALRFQSVSVKLPLSLFYERKFNHLGKDFHCMLLFHRQARYRTLLQIAPGDRNKFLIDSVLPHHKLPDNRSRLSN